MAEAPDMNYWLGVKYSILGKQAEGEYQRNTADASSLPGLREAQSFNLRAGGQESVERAATEAARRYYDPEWLRMMAPRLGYPDQPAAGPPSPPGTGAVQAPAQAPTTGTAPVQAPTQTPETRPPIQFQQLPPVQQQQQQLPTIAPPTTAAPTTAPPATVAPVDIAPPATAAPLPTGTLSPQLQTPEQLTQGALAAAARRQQQLPPLPTLVRPLARPGFRRGTANVKRQGLKKGTPDVKPDTDFSSALLRSMTGATPNLPTPVLAPAVPGAVPTAGPPFVPFSAGPSPAPRSPSPMPSPAPDSSAVPPRPVPWKDPGGPAGPGIGTPYNPNAGYGVENIGGVVDATLRMVNPDRFTQALESMRPSENLEDRRGEAPYQAGATTPTSVLGSVGNFLGDAGSRVVQGGQMLATDIGRVLFGDRAAPGSLQDQLGYNNLPGITPSGILSGFSNPFAGPPSAGQPLAGPAGAPSQASPPPASSSLASPAPAAPAPTNQPSPESTTASQGLKKGSADVKGKGKSKGKSKPSAGAPQGLEALLPLLMAIQGGGGGGPPAGPPRPPAGPPVPGFKRGSANVKGKGKASKGDDQSSGLEALLAAIAAGGGGGPPAPGALPMPLAPGAPALPAQVRGYAAGGDVQMIPPTVPPLMSMVLPPTDNRYARGEENVDQYPGYPFGAGYLFGATTVPGEGTGRTDTVPAMLAPHEAVLNRAAADMLGRGLIAALNQRGVKQMGMHRGAA